MSDKIVKTKKARKVTDKQFAKFLSDFNRLNEEQKEQIRQLLIGVPEAPAAPKVYNPFFDVTAKAKQGDVVKACVAAFDNSDDWVQSALLTLEKFKEVLYIVGYKNKDTGKQLEGEDLERYILNSIHNTMGRIKIDAKKKYEPNDALEKNFLQSEQFYYRRNYLNSQKQQQEYIDDGNMYVPINWFKHIVTTANENSSMQELLMAAALSSGLRITELIETAYVFPHDDPYKMYFYGIQKRREKFVNLSEVKEAELANRVLEKQLLIPYTKFYKLLTLIRIKNGKKPIKASQVMAQHFAKSTFKAKLEDFYLKELDKYGSDDAKKTIAASYPLPYHTKAIPASEEFDDEEEPMEEEVEEELAPGEQKLKFKFHLLRSFYADYATNMMKENAHETTYKMKLLLHEKIDSTSYYLQHKILSQDVTAFTKLDLDNDINIDIPKEPYTRMDNPDDDTDINIYNHDVAIDNDLLESIYDYIETNKKKLSIGLKATKKSPTKKTAAIK